jgi:hypothetical protein
MLRVSGEFIDIGSIAGTRYRALRATSEQRSGDGVERGGKQLPRAAVQTGKHTFTEACRPAGRGGATEGQLRGIKRGHRRVSRVQELCGAEPFYHPHGRLTTRADMASRT